jgi:hypothetical protein
MGRVPRRGPVPAMDAQDARRWRKLSRRVRAGGGGIFAIRAPYPPVNWPRAIEWWWSRPKRKLPNSILTREGGARARGK